MLKISFESEQDIITDTEKLKELIENAASCALSYMDFTKDCEISVTVTDNGNIRELNREYRGIDRATDVLSFPMYSFADGDIPDEAEQEILLGDIVISAERAVEQAKEYGHGNDREISFLTVHSVLHLLGYDHETSAEDEKEMFDLQDKIMEKLGIGR